MLTINAFREMIAFNDVLNKVTYNKKKFTSICLKFEDSTRSKKPCRMDAKPIDFVYDVQSDTYDLD